MSYRKYSIGEHIVYGGTTVTFIWCAISFAVAAATYYWGMPSVHSLALGIGWANAVLFCFFFFLTCFAPPKPH